MSHLLHILGRGLGSDLGDLLDRYFWAPQRRSLAELEENCRLHPDWPDIRLHLALAYLRGAEVDQAITHLKHACRRKPDYLAARLALASAYSEQGKTEDALEQLELANQTSMGEVPVLFSIGFCLEKLGRTDEARQYYRDAIEGDGQFLQARERLAAIAVLKEDLNEAIGQYEILRDSNPQESWLRTALAHLYYRNGKFDKAVENFEKAIGMEPENWSLLDDEVEALVGDGQIREAMERLHTLLEQQGPFADIHCRLADLYSQVGDDDAAVKYYKAALEQQPEYLEAKVKLGTHHLVCGRWEEAAEMFHQAVEINDQSMVNYVGLGVAQMGAGLKARAMNSFDLAAAVEPNSTMLLAEMAKLQLRSAVAEEFERSFRMDPESPVAELELDNDDLLAEQIVRHKEEVARHPNRADIHYRYGVLLRAEGQLVEARDQFAAAVDINPSYYQAVIKLGIVQQDLGQIDEVIETFRAVLDVNPQFVDLHYRLGMLFTDRDRFEEAVTHMEEAANNAPDNEQVRAGLALSLQNMGLMDSAAATWRSLWKIHQAAKH